MTQHLDNALDAVSEYSPTPANDHETVYEVVNFSDKITLVASNIDFARVATLLLGRGAYGLVNTQNRQYSFPVLSVDQPICAPPQKKRCNSRKIIPT